MHRSRLLRLGISGSEGRARGAGGLDANGGGVMLARTVRMVTGRGLAKPRATRSVSGGEHEVWKCLLPWSELTTRQSYATKTFAKVEEG